MPGKPFQNALRSSLENLPPELLTQIAFSIDNIIASTPKTYSIYPPLLLLPAHTFASPEWSAIFMILPLTDKASFFSHLALSMKVTHIALNAPISATLPDNDDAPAEGGSVRSNVQRRPNITPLYGDFGNFIPENDRKRRGAKCPKNFDEAFWVEARQNGITQVWAPLYTMFSRGNITEKARLLTLLSVREAVSEPKGCTAVDLYAGIGYFAFSFARAGCQRVLGFEVNPWSVAGFRKGAEANGWTCGWIVVEDPIALMDEVGIDHDGAKKDRLVVFEMSNVFAPKLVEYNRARLPPVRHVNLGLLPTSRVAYKTAVECLDPEVGGWMHVHENFATKEIAEKAGEVTEKIRTLARELKGADWEADLEHVEKVKTYAPGVMHCVLDIHVRTVQNCIANC